MGQRIGQRANRGQSTEGGPWTSRLTSCVLAPWKSKPVFFSYSCRAQCGSWRATQRVTAELSEA